MVRGAFRHIGLLVITIAAVCAWSTPASAQSQAELRRENQKLKTQVKDLEQELAASLAEIEKLKQDILQLHAARTGSGTRRVPAPPLPEEKVTIDESIPNASPRALLKALMDDYRTTTADMAFGEEERSTERALYIKTVQRWTARVNRQYRAQIEWRVRIVGSAVRSGSGLIVRMQAIDPETNVELGDPFDVMISRSIANRLKRTERSGDLPDGLVLKGVLVPKVYFNQSRLSEGVFNNPRIIGPMAEFALTVEAKSLLVPQPKAEPEEAEGEHAQENAER